MDLWSLILAFVVGGLTVSLFFLKRYLGAAISNGKDAEEEPVAQTEIRREERPAESKSKKRQTAVERRTKESKQLFTHPWHVTTLKGHTSHVLDLDLSPNGKYLTSCAEDRTLLFWKVKDLVAKNHQPIRCAVEFDHASKVAWSPDSKAVVIYRANDREIEVFKAQKKPEGGLIIQTAIRFPKHHTHDLVGFGIASNGKYIMSCDSEGELVIWSLKGSILHSLHTKLSPAYCAKISPDGKLVAVSGFTPDVKVLQVCLNKAGDYDRVQRAFELKGHSSGVLAVDFNSDTSRAVTVSKDGTWRFYDIRVEYEKGQEPYLLKTGTWPYANQPTIVALAPDAKSLAISNGNKIYTFDTSTATSYGTLTDVHNDSIAALVFDPESRYLISTGDRYIHILHNVAGHFATISDLRPKRKTAATSAQKERIDQLIREAVEILKQVGENVEA